MKRGIFNMLAAVVVFLIALTSCTSPAEPVPAITPLPSTAPAGDMVEQYRKAPDFEAIDSQGRPIKLSDYIGRKHILMVINRGFG